MPALTTVGVDMKSLLTGQGLEGIELFNNSVIGGNLLTPEEFDRLLQTDQGKQKIEELITLRSSLIDEWRLRWASRGSLLIALAVSISAATVPGGIPAALMVLTASAIGMVGVGSWMYRGIGLMPEINKELGQLLGDNNIKFNDSATMSVQALSIFYDVFLNQRQADIQAIINSVVTGNVQPEIAVNAVEKSIETENYVKTMLFSKEKSREVQSKQPSVSNKPTKPQM